MNNFMRTGIYFIKFFSIISLFILVANSAAFCQPPTLPPSVTVDKSTDFINLTQHIIYTVDKTSTLTIDQILNPSKPVKFIRHQQDSINLGFDSSTLWSAFSLHNTDHNPLEIVLEVPFPLIDTIRLYQVDFNGKLNVLSAGELIHNSQTQSKDRYRNPKFRVTLKPRNTQKFYLSAQDKGSVPFSLELRSLHAFELHKLKDNALFGGYFSLFSVILLYNLIVFCIIKTKTHFYYVCYLLSLLLWQATYSGHASLFLWPNHTYLTNHAVPFFISVAAICGILFSKHFLKTSIFAPKINKFLNLLFACFVVTLFMSFIPDYTISVILAAFFSILFTLLIFVTGITSWKNGFKPARYFTVAWFFLLSGTLLLALKSFGVIPSTFVTEYGQYMGSLFEIFLLSLALVDMIEVLKKEREEALHNAFDIEIEAKEKLEIKVADRTRELTQINNHLEDVSSKLSKYLSPQIYNSIFSGKTNATRISSRKHLTVFFSDIVGFTDLTDSIEPEELSRILNDYLTEMAEIALKYGGTIDKFIGDSVMVFYGDPETRGDTEDAVLCVKMAIEMQERIRTFHTQFPQTLSHSLQVRMGIHSGFCTVGSFGAEKRLEYTIIGGAVNLASRLEGVSEPGMILISSSTYSHIKDVIACKKHKTVKVKGINAPVDTYLVLDTGSDDILKAGTYEEKGDGYSVFIDLNGISSESKDHLVGQLTKTLQKLQAL
nr:hypothetical protein [Desulfobulbaceae bacterium]